MANIRDLYDSIYSPRMSIVLRTLGGDPDAIKAYWQDRLDNPTEEELAFRTMFPMFGSLTPEAAAEAAYNQIVREIEHMYFAGMRRETEVAIANELMRSGLATFSIVSGEMVLTYTDMQLARAWNDHNPDAEPIQAPHSDIG